MNLQGQHILKVEQFDKDTLLSLFELAKEMEGVKDGDQMKGKLMATLFYEASTRTRFSFEAAMLRLGGNVLSNADMNETSSAKKMETLYDTGKVVSQMADVIVMRHPEAGKVEELSKGSDVPVINGGDGSNDHPTQALLDLYTMWKHFGKIDALTIGFVGDLKNSRVLRANAKMLSLFDVKFVKVSPEELKFSIDVPGDETDDLSSVIADLDVLSINRIQKERFENPEDAEKHRGKFVLSKEILAKSKDEMIVLCPLPRMEELPVEIDGDAKCKYFEQIGNGVAMRMALLSKVL